MKRIFLISAIAAIIISFGNSSIKAQTTTKDKGIGPFKTVTLGAIDPAKVKKGQNLYNNKCVACHDLDKKKLAPPLRNITKTREPEFILNQIVNPTEMQKSDPIAKEQLKKYNNLPMTDLKTSQAEALNLLDYLRSVAK
jgi:cytochrome c